jgi:hypothetical protein
MNSDQRRAIFLKIINYVNKVQKITLELYGAAEQGELKINNQRIGLLPEAYFIGRVEKIELGGVIIQQRNTTVYGLNYSSLNDIILSLSIEQPEFNLLLSTTLNELNLQNNDLAFERLISVFTNKIVHKTTRQIVHQKLSSENYRKGLKNLQLAGLMMEYKEVVEYQYQKDTVREKLTRREDFVKSTAEKSSEVDNDQINKDGATRNLDKHHKEILHLVDSLIIHLAGSRHLYGGDAFLYGIKVVNEISLAVNGIVVVIRPIMENDFEYVYNLEEYIEFKLQNQFKERIPSAKISIKYEALEDDQVFLNFEKIIASLRLFRLGSIDYSEFHLFSTSILEQNDNANADNEVEKVKTVYRRRKSVLDKSGDFYLLALQDEACLNLFLGQVFKEIPENFINPELPQNYLSIAYGYYIESIIGNSSFESRLATAIMGIESLFLSERGELKSRLSNRMAKVLGLFKTNDAAGLIQSKQRK